ncbi:DNA (cytosine-5)-methyltransferase 1 [Gracilibacillus alcaliphilus]|nr:DNA (cytosine-5)-methyltransferase 1 [Gracilibacillus alcaliphilus]
MINMPKTYSPTSLKLKLPGIIDLFSGCGGLALGFQMAGFKIRSGLELDKNASEVASYNLHWKIGSNHSHITDDITLLEADNFYNHIDKNENFIVIGGPPCQAYSKIGRAKLNSLGENRRPENDVRGKLYENFLDYALNIEANAIVMENVPEAVDYDGVNIPETVCKILEENGYEAKWTILNAANFGVPQTRERLFVMAVKKSIGQLKYFPVPSHRPYSEKADTVNKLWLQSKIKNQKYYEAPISPEDSLPYWITVGEAISDLPALFLDHNQKYKNNKPMVLKSYEFEPQNDFQALMRSNNQLNKVTGHMFRNTKRDFPIFAQMKEGDNYLSAHKIAMTLLREEMRRQGILESDTEKAAELKRKIVPPYSTEKFLGKWKKLSLTKPSHTLVAHLSTDTYSHLHPVEPRGISVREAARLQSFPDDFIFNCSMGAAFKQIGNAVPPLLSKAIALAMIKNMEGDQ